MFKKLLMLAVATATMILAAQPLRVAIISDAQPGGPGGYKKKGHPYWYVDKAYKTAKQLGVDAIIFAGDISDHSNVDNYREFRQIYDDNFAEMGANAPKWFVVMGNHDYWAKGYYRPDCKLPDPWGRDEKVRATRREIFRQELKLDSVNPVEVVKGFDFIGVSLHNGMSANQADIDHLQKALEAAVKRDPNKPIIVFGHNHVGNTLVNSSGNQNMYNLFKKYPQIIYISGHTHTPLEDERSIHQKDFTSLNTATLNWSYMDARPKLRHGGVHLGKHLIYMTIDDKEVVLKRIQLRDDTELLSDDGKPWTLQLPLTPETFNYTPEKQAERNALIPAPAFPADAKLTVTPMKNKAGAFTGIKLAGPAATHKRFVHEYQVVVSEKAADGTWKKVPHIKWDRRKKAYLPINAPLVKISDFYMGLKFRQPTFDAEILDQPDKKNNYHSNIGVDFQAGKTYKFEVTAYETFGKKSATTLVAECVIPQHENPAPEAK